jgi:molybdopterin-biosynthesis enzyme MoeA-like protein
MKIGEIILGASFIILIAGLSYGFHNKQSWEVEPLDIQPTPGFPEEIMKIVINSCYDCHSGDSQNKMAKNALNFSIWSEYKTAKKVQLLNKMHEVIGEERMPPGKYLNNNPDKKLTGEQVITISKWTDEEADKLLK